MNYFRSIVIGASIFAAAATGAACGSANVLSSSGPATSGGTTSKISTAPISLKAHLPKLPTTIKVSVTSPSGGTGATSAGATSAGGTSAGGTGGTSAGGTSAGGSSAGGSSAGGTSGGGVTTGGGGGVASSAPRVNYFTVDYPHTCVQGNASAVTPVVAWSTTNATGVALSIDDPGLQGASGDYGPSGSISPTSVGCDSAPGTVITHYYDLWTLGGTGSPAHRSTVLHVTVVAPPSSSSSSGQGATLSSGSPASN